MKLSNWYLKLFASLLLILLGVQVYFFFQLNFTAKKSLSPERDQNRAVRIQMLKALIEENIRLNHGFVAAQKDLKEIISTTGRLYEAKIWIEDAEGTPLLESFTPEERPEKNPAGLYRKAKRGDVSIQHVLHDDIKMFFTDVPLDPDAASGLSLHIFYQSVESNYLSQFTIGLSGIILVMAVLTLSLLQFIRIKVNRFRKSVLRIADGDLSHRITVNGRGVVEELGHAFNSMTDKLEKMITSSKEITANISHEIRTPLARIRVVEDLLRKKFSRGEFSGYEKHLDNIREDIQILDDLVGRLLEFIKLDNYESIPNYEQIDPEQLINDLLLRFEPVIESKDLVVKKDVSRAAVLTGNRRALTSAFLNILDNAFKFTSEQGAVSIKTASENGCFETSVTNSFARLDQREMADIFKPFERARHSDSSGSGLGLAITKKIIEKHGGTLTALNSGEGFEIRIHLPL